MPLPVGLCGVNTGEPIGPAEPTEGRPVALCDPAQWDGSDYWPPPTDPAGR